jgi:hypothetical protein
VLPNFKQFFKMLLCATSAFYFASACAYNPDTDITFHVPVKLTNVPENMSVRLTCIVYYSEGGNGASTVNIPLVNKGFQGTIDIKVGVVKNLSRTWTCQVDLRDRTGNIAATDASDPNQIKDKKLPQIMFVKGAI